MSRKEQIREAYKITGNSGFYDGMITCTSFLGTLVSRVVWSIGPEENLKYIDMALSGIPEGFAGRMLEVPIGTGALTIPFYKALKNADITCLDYSRDMMGQAREKAEKLGVDNITFVQGDVGNLPFEDESFDVVLSMNGFHAFPDKEAAYKETFRVLKKGGTFCGCFYVKGENRKTDWIIKNMYQPAGFFTPPYETVESLRKRLENMYEEVEVNSVESIVCFRCRK